MGEANTITVLKGEKNIYKPTRRGCVVDYLLSLKGHSIRWRRPVYQPFTSSLPKPAARLKRKLMKKKMGKHRRVAN